MWSSRVAGLAFPRTVQAGDTVLGDLGVRVVMPIWIRHKVKGKERRGTGLGPRDSTSEESVEEEKLMQETQSSEWSGWGREGGWTSSRINTKNFL